MKSFEGAGEAHESVEPDIERIEKEIDAMLLRRAVAEAAGDTEERDSIDGELLQLYNKYIAITGKPYKPAE